MEKEQRKVNATLKVWGDACDMKMVSPEVA